VVTSFIVTPFLIFSKYLDSTPSRTILGGLTLVFQ
jgi:hypothetical protein